MHLSQPAAIGSQVINVEVMACGLEVGMRVSISPRLSNHEVATISGFGSILFDAPLKYDHATGEEVVVLLSSPATDAVPQAVGISSGVGFGLLFLAAAGYRLRRYRRLRAAARSVSTELCVPAEPPPDDALPWVSPRPQPLAPDSDNVTFVQPLVQPPPLYLKDATGPTGLDKAEVTEEGLLPKLLGDPAGDPVAHAGELPTELPSSKYAPPTHSRVLPP